MYFILRTHLSSDQSHFKYRPCLVFPILVHRYRELPGGNTPELSEELGLVLIILEEDEILIHWCL